MYEGVACQNSLFFFLTLSFITVLTLYIGSQRQWAYRTCVEWKSVWRLHIPVMLQNNRKHFKWQFFYGPWYLIQTTFANYLSGLLIRRSNRVKSETIFHISQQKHKLLPLIRTVSPEASNDRLQCMFSWKNQENYPLLIPFTPSHLEHKFLTAIISVPTSTTSSGIAITHTTTAPSPSATPLSPISVTSSKAASAPSLVVTRLLVITATVGKSAT